MVHRAPPQLACDARALGRVFTCRHNSCGSGVRPQAANAFPGSPALPPGKSRRLSGPTPLGIAISAPSYTSGTPISSNFPQTPRSIATANRRAGRAKGKHLPERKTGLGEPLHEPMRVGPKVADTAGTGEGRGMQQDTCRAGKRHAEGGILHSPASRRGVARVPNAEEVREKRSSGRAISGVSAAFRRAAGSRHGLGYQQGYVGLPDAPAGYGPTDGVRPVGSVAWSAGPARYRAKPDAPSPS